MAKKNTWDLLATHRIFVSPDKCDRCKKTFGLTEHLKDHKLTHSGELSSNKCVECSKSFPFANKLKTNMTIHSGEKLHNCAQFTEAGHLKLHKLTHSGEKSHNCSQCDKSFNRAGTLTRHLLTRHSLKLQL